MQQQTKLSNRLAIPEMVSLMMAIGFSMLFVNNKVMLDNVDKAYSEGRACNLSKVTKAGQLAKVLYDEGYLNHVEDANFVASWITTALQENPMPNLGMLNKKEFRIPVSTALAHGGPETRERAEQAIVDEGFTEEVSNLYANLPDANTVVHGDGEHLIEVEILRPDSSTSLFHHLMCKLSLSPEGMPAPNVAVCLRGYSYEHSSDDFGNVTLSNARDSIIGYAISDKNGVARFRVPSGFYSAMPVRRGCSYGAIKGTSDHALNKDVRWTFHERPLTITPLSERQYARVKLDLALTARTPAQYRDCLVISLMMFLGVWWISLLLLIWNDKRRLRNKDCRLHSLPFDHISHTMLMTLTGIGLLSMYGIANPLVDTNFGKETTTAIVIGVMAMTASSLVSLPRLFNDRRFLNPQGKGYLRYFLIAHLLMLLLFVFGTGPQGSNAKVNLGPFQPSEITKYLIVLAIAIFFSQKAELIQTFSQRSNLRQKGRLLAKVGSCMALMMLAYTCLNDMGPALVSTVTFVMLYSVARRDTPQLFTGTVTFIAVLMIGHHVNPTANTMMAFALLWLIGWIAWGAVFHGRLYESAILMVGVISAFIFSGDLFALVGAENIANRLNSRVAMAWSGVWDNDIAGGDQVAHGIWALAAGGWSGMGLGRGTPNLIPAYNTDFVVASVGETMGGIAILLFITCLAALLHRALLLARRAAHPFVFFLLSGISLATGVQFFTIALGCLGIIPLTGVSVPFLSYGKTSLIVNLAVFGLVLSGSREKGTDRQRRNILSYDNVVASSAFLFICLCAVTLFCMAKYQIFARDKYLVRPAVTITSKGVPFVEYNPRIARLERKLIAGNIYDRNGLLLATSNPEDITQARGQLVNAGLDRNLLSSLSQRRQHRYYPFGMHTVFAIGDANDGLVRNENSNFPIGYGAEYRLSLRLRGFGDKLHDSAVNKTVSVRSRHYRPYRFLPETGMSFNITLRDFSNPDFLRMLKAGEHSDLVRRWNENRERRDVRLTIDARLQTMLQNRMEREFSEITRNGGAGPRGKFRASVVVVNAANGDLLCSANYPLPTRQGLTSNMRYSDVERDRTPGTITNQDLGTTFFTQPGSSAKVITQLAAFRKLGPNAASLTYNIRANERIHETRTGEVDMETALVRSINAFHIHLTHDQNLYHQLAEIDYLVGMRLHLGYGSTDRRNPYLPYCFYPAEQACDTIDYYGEMNFLALDAIPLYRRLYEHNGLIRGKSWTTAWQLGIAWGQHNIYASPLTMARAVAIVANDGRLTPTRYVTDEPVTEPTRIIDSRSAAILRDFMRAESRSHGNLPANMGGKTGTPIRNMPGRSNLVNDAWYICFIPLSDGTPIAIAMRLERSVSNSRMAVQYIGQLVLRTLLDAGYDFNMNDNNNNNND